ncbi:MAG: hypothetical protein IPM36_00035 [Lewinellaceae bacterium]|nr:hypothetical protein [Lewinellaceae bacterium]
MKKSTSKRTINKDPFLQRAIEYWLDSANELGYQPLFCEWLISQGYVLKYSIRNTNFEQGKDVLAIAQTGIAHAYQLKGGNISLNRWRKEVKPEIEAMMDCAIQHPDVDKNKPHISYLVTNGEIEDALRVEIVALNDGKWSNSPLRVWTRGDLLTGFQEMAEGILPKDAPTYRELTDLMFSDGTGLPDIPKINQFLSQILNINDSSLKKEQRRRDIAGAVLYATMIAGPYRRVENHGSTIRIMVLLLSLIFYLVDKYNLDEKYWIKSYEIIWNDILITARLLESEVNTNGFDAAFTSPFDTDLISFRKHSVTSIIYALKLSQFIDKDDAWKTIIDPTFAQKYKGALLLSWGEAAFIPLILIICIFKNFEKGQISALNSVRSMISMILTYNGRNSKHPLGLFPTYFDIDFAVKIRFGMIDQALEDNYKRSSYLLKPLIELIVRLGKRDLIAESWREISFMHFEEFIPDNSVDFYLWRAQKGENRSTLPKKEKSWSELIQETNSFDGQTLPPMIKRFPAFLPFFLSVFPHRANSETIGFLYKVSN